MPNRPDRSHLAYAAAGFALAALITATVWFPLSAKRDSLAIMAVTGATPLALKEGVSAGFSLEVSGATERVYRFGRAALDAFAAVYRRTLEVSPAGEFEGSYRYTGIPVLHILEGIVPKKANDAPFDRPLDMVVTFVSAGGDRRHFSYGELTMTGDRDPVLLAYARAELLPAKPVVGETYAWNKQRGPLTGLRLVCPAEPTTARYLDDVVKIVLFEPVVDNAGLPPMKRDGRCRSDSLTVVRRGVAAPLSFTGVERTSVAGWVRTGHGRGFKGIAAAAGYDLRSLLRRNIPDAGVEQFFLFVACDGYRALFSGREIFGTEAGRRMMLLETIDGEATAGGFGLGPVEDYYVDRMVRGLTHIVVLDDVEESGARPARVE
ncbi:MAG: hypothetical protein PHQ53_05340 [Candidatus Krumholzibacteria bacterium]|nr:hypothetical protein [Candidatus Krumholzibacteria bacterium]